MPRRNQGPRLRFLEKRNAFYIAWTDTGRSRERSTGTADRGQAEIALAEFIRQRTRNAACEVLVTDILAEYADEHATATAAPWRIGCAVAGLVPYWQERTVANVTPETCRAYGRMRGRSDGTVRRELGVLRAAINHAYREGRLTRPVPVRLPDRPEPRDRWLTRREAAALLKASKTPHARFYLPLFILIGFYTGRRKEAILSLRWPQVDFEAKLIDFEGIGRKRTNKRRGTVRIPPRLLPHLRRARRRGSDIGYVLHIDGQRIGDIKKGFAAACGRAGLEEVTPHTLRHTAATWLMQRGVPTWEAAGFLAMSEETLRNVYGHHHPNHMKTAAEAIGRRGR